MECFALLDDASAADPRNAGLQPHSRLYSGHAGTLQCADADNWPGLLTELQAATARGLYAVGVFSYELGGNLLGIPTHASDTLPAQVLLFDTCTHLSPAEVGAWLAVRVSNCATPAGIAAVQASLDAATFTGAIDRIRELIAAGDTYQVNYTYRLRFDAFGDICALYARLRARQPVPYGALIALPDGGAVLSLSPELFVRHQDGELLARPMKGTAPASDDVDAGAENARRAASLAADPKNRAENLMIVDLLRNDLGRVAVTGSVEVPALFDVQRYSGVLQMTSTVRARLRPGVGLGEIFTALYPCGSITGAPKRRTMEIIHELEGAPRGVYTGAIGWFDPAAPSRSLGDFCLSVPIRTLALQPHQGGVRRGEMGVGAGIVYDSVAEDEYAECQLKARFLTGLTNDFEVFETMYATRDHGVRHNARHLARMQASAGYFGFPWHDPIAQLEAACAALGDGPHRLRLALGTAGIFSVQSAPIVALAQPVSVLVAELPTSATDIFLRHKTSIRSRYDAAWRDAEARGAFDTLFFNERGELTEGGRSNVFVQVDGRWITPALSCGVLPGVMRGVLLDDPAWDAMEAVITRTMFERATAVVVCNALRGPMPALVQEQ